MKNSILFLTIVAFLFAGCGATGDNSAEAEPASAESIEAEAKETEKMNAYVGLLNNFGKWEAESFKRYLSWCDEKTGPTGKERAIYGVDDLDAYKADLENIKAIIPANSTQPIDKYAKAFVDASLPLIDIVHEAHYYYDQDNYKDDNMAKGKELHPKLMSAFKAVSAAEQPFEAEYEKLFAAKSVKQNEELRKQGKLLALNIQEIVRKSETLVEELMKVATNTESKPTEPQLNSLKTKIDEIETLTLAFESNVKKEGEEKLKTQFGRPDELDDFADDSKDFLKNAKEIYRHRKESKEMDTFYERLVSDFTDTYDKMVQTMNNCGILL